jgi:hypothetical protein
MLNYSQAAPAMLIPLWPGPPHLFKVYDDGWRAFSRFCDTLEREEREEDFATADPYKLVPPRFRGNQLRTIVWAMGWCEHMVAGLARWRACECGITDPEIIERIATNAVAAQRAFYMNALMREYGN